MYKLFGLAQLVAAIFLLLGSVAWLLFAAPVVALPALWLGWVGIGLFRKKALYLRKAQVTHWFFIPLELLALFGTFQMLAAAEASAQQGGGLLGGLPYFFIGVAVLFLALSVATLFVLSRKN